MAALTKPGSRVDLLLTLGRLTLPDALKRANQPVAVAILFAVVFFALATVATLGLLPAIFAIESDALRRNLLSLIAGSVTALALLTQVTLRAPVAWLLDLEDLLGLPIGFRDLYGLRFALSTIGFWLPVLGPAAIYLTLMRSGGASGVPLTLLGILSMVWIFGRTAAILSLLVSRSVEGALGTLAMVAIMAACQGAILLGAMALAGELGSEGIVRAIEESAILGGLGYTPPGLVAGIVHEPGLSAPNLARLGGLLATLGALAALERRLLLRSYLERPGGDRRTASGILPLTGMLRRTNRLTPRGVLTLLEIECLLRLKRARLVLAIPFGFALVWVPVEAGLAVGMAAILGVLLNEFRVSKQPSTCHVWRESLTLPFSLWRIFSAPGHAANAVILSVVAFILGLATLNWFGWLSLVAATCLMAAGILMATATYGVMQAYWPQRNAGLIHNLDGSKLGASFVVIHLTILPGFLSFLLWVLQESQRVTPLTAALIAIGVLLLAIPAAYVSRRWQQRVLRTRGRELLLEDAPH